MIWLCWLCSCWTILLGMIFAKRFARPPKVKWSDSEAFKHDIERQGRNCLWIYDWWVIERQRSVNACSMKWTHIVRFWSKLPTASSWTKCELVACACRFGIQCDVKCCPSLDHCSFLPWSPVGGKELLQWWIWVLWPLLWVISYTIGISSMRMAR